MSEGPKEGLSRWEWDSVCRNCGRPVKGLKLSRQFPWEKVLPYCRLCDEYALRGVHFAALAAAVIVPLVALTLLLRYMFTG